MRSASRLSDRGGSDLSRRYGELERSGGAGWSIVPRGGEIPLPKLALDGLELVPRPAAASPRSSVVSGDAMRNLGSLSPCRHDESLLGLLLHKRAEEFLPGERMEEACSFLL